MTTKTDRLGLIALIASTEDEELIQELQETVQRRSALQQLADPTRDYISLHELKEEQLYEPAAPLALRGNYDINEDEMLEIFEINA